MEKPKVSAKGISKDINAGLSNAQIQAKYGLTEKQLESIFRKLVGAGLFTEVELSSRRSVPEESPPASGDAQAVLADLKAGVHKVEIMSRHELSPSEYDNIVSELVQSGALPQSEVEAREPARMTKCRFCSATIPVGQEQCPSCGQWLDGRDSTPERIQARLQPPPIAAQTLVSDKYCPWEERESLGLMNAFFQTVVRCLVTPASFFSELPLDKGYLNPLAFGVVSTWAGVFLFLVWVMIIKGGGGLIGLLFWAGVAFVACAPGALLGLCIWGLAVHGCLLLVGGARAGLQATFRVVSYSSCTQVFNAVPVVGNIASLYALVLSVIGLKETHETSTGKAAAAVGVPVGIILIVGLIAIVPAMRSSSTSGSGQVAGAEYSGEPLPTELCEAVDSFVTDVEAAVLLADRRATQVEIERSVKEFISIAGEFSSHTGSRKAVEKAGQFAAAKMAEAHLKGKVGTLPEAVAGQFDPGRFKQELMAMCGR